mgnify:FL=1
MKLKSFAVTTLAASLATASSVPAMAETPPEEQRGAVIGALVGGVAGGPFGAGVGAIVGGGLIGNLVATHRERGELEVSLAETEAAWRAGRAEITRLAGTVMDLDADLQRMVDLNAVAFKRPQLGVQFRTASAEVEEHFEPMLERVAKVLARNPDATVSLAGHADRRGDSRYNHELSLKRANAVKAFLVEQGAGSAQVIVAAYGETRSLKGPGVGEGRTHPDTHSFDRRVVVDIDLDVTSQLATR